MLPHALDQHRFGHFRISEESSQQLRCHGPLTRLDRSLLEDLPSGEKALLLGVTAQFRIVLRLTLYPALIY